MYITVRHGADERVIFNPLCRVANLLSEIKTRCNITDGDLDCIDLCDESGQVKNLPLHKRAYASKYLTVPGTYVVVERKKIPLIGGKELAVNEMNDTKDGEEDESILSVTVYRSLLKNTEMLLPGFSIKNFQSPPRKEPRKVNLARQRKELEKVQVTPTSPTPRASSTLRTTKLAKIRNKVTR
ncbi:uncharacterized protein LOC134818914 [Bolinopsis microptera]|uniref:uncharacterized protein LOC134818914 n=1 Tax=Bolinopsis microptera TaxID=2820187 RepID=UPI00307A2E99